jgi:hypothetical protein
VECNRTNGKEIIMDARVDYRNALTYNRLNVIAQRPGGDYQPGQWG